MKIAILTQPLGYNYGGIMQAYALQQVVVNLGHDVVTLDRKKNRNAFFVRMLLPFRSTVYKILGRKVLKNFTSNERKFVYSGMVSFVQKNIKMSEELFSTKSLRSHYVENSYDLIIVGSDQVWRPKYSPNIYNFFGDFLKEKEKIIAYAASFGVDIWEFNEKQTRVCSGLASNFKAISVREKSGLKLAKEKLAVTAELVLDPTLLLSAKDYESLFKGKVSKNKGKILKYILDDNKNKTKIINEVSVFLNKDIFSAQPARGIDDIQGKSIEDYKFPDVEDWLMSFKDAEFVITDSFHGCVFSIIFNKPFIAIGNTERGLSRFQSLLELFGLSDRLVVDFKADFEILITENIDWTDVNEKVSNYKESSLLFLKKSL